MPDDSDEKFMRAAIGQALRGLGQTNPNPVVGAVLVAGDRIVSKGYHRAAGLGHAEVECLRGVSPRAAAAATLYVTMEPCSTTGRTGPCTEFLIASGVRTVCVGTIDPNPQHAGRGLGILEAAGIEVRSGILEAECAAINDAFNKWIRTGLPLVIAKCGMSLDGRLTRPAGEPRWLTGPASRRHVHRLRSEVDAILIGAETLRQDDPQLTVRSVKAARQPWRVIVTRSGKLPAEAAVFTDRFRDRTLVYRRRSLASVLKDLGRRGCTSVLIEGGGDVLGQALDARFVDKVQIYIAPLLTGGPVPAFAGLGAGKTEEGLKLRSVSYDRIGDDICVTGYTA